MKRTIYHVFCGEHSDCYLWGSFEDRKEAEYAKIALESDYSEDCGYLLPITIEEGWLVSGLIEK